jgi:subtilisin
MRYVLALVSAVSLTAAALAQGKAPDFWVPEKIAPRVVNNFTRGENTRWDATLINADKAWSFTKGKGVLGMVGDTGIDSDHPELKGTVIDAKDFTNSRSGVADRQGHGTHCAGIIAGHLQLDGIAPECKLISAKVLNDNGAGNFGDLQKAVEWGIEKKVRFMSFSLGSGPDRTHPEQFAPGLLASIRKAIKAGIIIIVAAGNDNGVGENGGFPARYAEVVPELIVVAACDASRNIAQFSTRSKSVVVTAPGVGILSALPGGRYAEWDGTSMACPKVAGVAALYIADCDAAGVKPSPAEFKALITKTSVTKNPKPPSITSGWGLIQADKFVGRKTGADPTPTPIPPTPPKRVLSTVITFEDLSPSKQAELSLGGITTFKLEVGHNSEFNKQVTPAAAPLDYHAAVAAVESGRAITLVVGGQKIAGAYYVDALEGIAPGVYDCRLEAGKPTMRQRIVNALPRYQPVPLSGYLPSGGCPGGICPRPFRFR